jgi:acyl-ACP thioesterase
MSEVAELSEIVPEPEAGRVFEQTIWPGVADATPAGRVRLDGIARWLQDVAYQDSVDAGFPDPGVWILRRVRINVSSFPRFGEPATLRTFCSGLGRFAAERRTSISSEAGRVECVALWVLLDPESGRPRRFPPEFVELYRPSAGDRDARVHTRHPEPPSGAAQSDWLFRAADLDLADHVNNSHYWEPLEEELAGTEPDSFDAEVEFRDPARAGPARVLRDGDAWWIASENGELHASLVVRIASTR